MTGPLRAEAVQVRYGQVLAIAHAEFEVAAGQLVAITGPSGAGKSSLLSALAGLIRPSAGTVRLGEHPLADRDDAVRCGIVLIPQGNALLRTLTALENVAMPLVVDRAGRQSARERAERALDSVGLAEAADQLLEELSGGQQQRVAVVRGLASDGAVVLADEPTSELDAANRMRVIGLLRDAAERGAVVLVATHDPEAAELCDAELRLSDGVLSVVRDSR